MISGDPLLGILIPYADSPHTTGLWATRVWRDLPLAPFASLAAQRVANDRCAGKD